MGEEKPDTLDFVKDFQEYLSQQTQHVNMISGSVSGVKEADELPPGNDFTICTFKLDLFLYLHLQWKYALLLCREREIELARVADRY